MEQGVDSRALFATFVTKLPGLMILAVAGAAAGSALNLLVVLVKMQDVCYVSETEYYVAFAPEQDEARHWYNAFTWNDVLGLDLILGRALELLGGGYERSQVREMIRADILSDVRYLTVTVRGQDPVQVEEIKNALGTALAEFGEVMEEFSSIYKVEDLEIVREEIPYFAWRAAFLGAVIAAGTGVFATAFCFCMGSVFYTKGDITARLGLPVCGMTFRGTHRGKSGSALEERQTKMLQAGLKMLTENYSQIVLIDAFDGQEASLFLQELRDRQLADDSCFLSYNIESIDRQIRENPDIAFLAVVPFGRLSREKITDEIEYVRLHGGKVAAAVLAQADRTWSAVYFGAGRM